MEHIHTIGDTRVRPSGSAKWSVFATLTTPTVRFVLLPIGSAPGGMETDRVNPTEASTVFNSHSFHRITQ